MTFSLFHPDNPSGLHKLVTDFACADPLTVVVGAGASMEVGLPSWATLVDRALEDAANAKHPLRGPLRRRPRVADVRKQWIDAIRQTDDLPGVLSIVHTILGKDEFRRRLPAWVFGDDLALQNVQPGALASAIAELCAVRGCSMRIATTNYDLLLERALAKVGDPRITATPIPFSEGEFRPAGNYLEVVHLHGYIGDRGKVAKPVATEQHYHDVRMPTSWQEAFFRHEALSHGRCLFVGTSLQDHDIREFLYRWAPRDRRARQRRAPAVLFANQTDEHLDTELRLAIREDLQKRWHDGRIQAHFVDYTGDISVAVSEIAYASSFTRRKPRWERRSGHYVGLYERTRAWILAFEQQCVRRDSHTEFIKSQISVVAWLDEEMREARRVAKTSGRFTYRRGIAAIWIANADGTGVKRWFMSDRVCMNPDTVDEYATGQSQPPALVARQSNNLVVRGSDRGRARLVGSRWQRTLSLPLNVDCGQCGKLPVGAITVGFVDGVADGAAILACARYVENAVLLRLGEDVRCH